MIALWQAVGFAHGVMNTDNMSILGLTLDYGPYGFLDAYHPAVICNHSDDMGRYAFDRQPTIGLWNCYALAESLSTLIDLEPAKEALATFEPIFRQAYLGELRAKLGLLETEDEDGVLLGDLLQLMQLDRADYTNTLRALGDRHRRATTERFTRMLIRRSRARSCGRVGRPLPLAARTPSLPATIPSARPGWTPRIRSTSCVQLSGARSAIEAAQRKDYGEVRRLASRSFGGPSTNNPSPKRYAATAPPDWAKQHQR